MEDKQPSKLDAILNPLKAGISGLMADGTLKAAFTQGIDEIGTALKPFNDSIQASATGTVFHPLQSEMAKERGAFDRENTEETGKSLVAQVLDSGRDPIQRQDAGQEAEYDRGR